MVLRLECPAGYFGGNGDTCQQCPEGAVCHGGVADPVSDTGFYPLSRTQFVQCEPIDACVGAANYTAVQSHGTASCASNYVGVRCSTCAMGSYRLNGGCKKCPGTAWLLFLAFSVAILVSVAAAVYLSKKKINFAGLSIGVVRDRWGSVMVVVPWLCVTGLSLCTHS